MSIDEPLILKIVRGKKDSCSPEVYSEPISTLDKNKFVSQQKDILDE
ncbi:hypothetical protein [Desulfosporosinus sp. SB140]